jgi:integrase
LGIEIDPTAMRHTYITDALIAGMSPVVLAECVGHRSLTMIMRTYNQLKKKREELRKQMGGLIVPPILVTETPQGPQAESVSGS